MITINDKLSLLQHKEKWLKQVDPSDVHRHLKEEELVFALYLNCLKIQSSFYPFKVRHLSYSHSDPSDFMICSASGKIIAVELVEATDERLKAERVEKVYKDHQVKVWEELEFGTIKGCTIYLSP